MISLRAINESCTISAPSFLIIFLMIIRLLTVKQKHQIVSLAAYANDREINKLGGTIIADLITAFK